MWPSYFIYHQHEYQQTYKIMGCFDTGKLPESGTRNGSVTPVWSGRILVHIGFCRANIMTVANARRFVASRGARRSSIAEPLWHIWLPAAPLRQLASSHQHACKSSPVLHLIRAWWNPDRVLGKSYFSLFFRPRYCQNTMYTGTFYRYRHCWIFWFLGSHNHFGSTGGTVRRATHVSWNDAMYYSCKPVLNLATISLRLERYMHRLYSSIKFSTIVI
jgi:hypothetical protein